MGKRNKYKARRIPQQDKRICGSICFCQMVVVFSSVSLIYLTVAVYIPSYKAFHSGFETTPVMCQTINTSMINNCSWASCGEWCLTKTSGFCPQIHVTARQNGTDIQIKNCTTYKSIPCPQVDTAALKRYNCNNGSACSALSGVFNCSLGHCANLSEIYRCHHKADGFVLDSDKDNVKLSGFFECKGSRCVKIKRHFSCDRYCQEIQTESSNVLISVGDALHIAQCTFALATTISNGNKSGNAISPQVIWKSDPTKVLMLSCNSIDHANLTINGTDCINGTVYNATDIPKPSMNFTSFWKIRNKWKQVMDVDQKFLPIQSALTIYTHSKLYINLDGCVNTLRGECREFLLRNGRDGRNQTAQSRFPCYYKKNDSFMVIARYDLEKTWQQLLVAMTVPSVLFIVSFLTLCIIMQSVKVGDDTKMRCKYCLGNGESDLIDLSPEKNHYLPSSALINPPQIELSKSESSEFFS